MRHPLFLAPSTPQFGLISQLGFYPRIISPPPLLPGTSLRKFPIPPILPLSLPASTRQARPLEEINFNQYTVTRCVANERDREENCSSGDPLKAI